MDAARRLNSITIKLKLKGAFRSGITISDAQSNARLSGADSYTFRDFNADIRGRITLKIKASSHFHRFLFHLLTICATQWAGYPSLTYDVPLDGYGERVNLQSLVRRTARAIVHFLQVHFTFLLRHQHLLITRNIDKYYSCTMELRRNAASGRSGARHLATLPRCAMMTSSRH